MQFTPIATYQWGDLARMPAATGRTERHPGRALPDPNEPAATGEPNDPAGFRRPNDPAATAGPERPPDGAAGAGRNGGERFDVRADAGSV